MRGSKRHFFSHLGSCFSTCSEVRVRGPQKQDLHFYEKGVYEYVFSYFEFFLVCTIFWSSRIYVRTYGASLSCAPGLDSKEQRYFVFFDGDTYDERSEE